MNAGFRKAFIRGIEWKWWDRIVLILIGMNTLQLALYNPLVAGNRCVDTTPYTLHPTPYTLHPTTS
jgi:hypothetical protein